MYKHSGWPVLFLDLSSSSDYASEDICVLSVLVVLLTYLVEHSSFTRHLHGSVASACLPFGTDIDMGYTGYGRQISLKLRITQYSRIHFAYKTLNLDSSKYCNLFTCLKSVIVRHILNKAVCGRPTSHWKPKQQNHGFHDAAYRSWYNAAWWGVWYIQMAIKKKERGSRLEFLKKIQRLPSWSAKWCPLWKIRQE